MMPPKPCKSSLLGSSVAMATCILCSSLEVWRRQCRRPRLELAMWEREGGGRSQFKFLILQPLLLSTSQCWCIYIMIPVFSPMSSAGTVLSLCSISIVLPLSLYTVSYYAANQWWVIWLTTSSPGPGISLLLVTGNGAFKYSRSTYLPSLWLFIVAMT